MFWNNKKINSEEYELLSKKISTIATATDELKAQIEILKTNMTSLRGVINRKINPEEADEKKSKDVDLGIFIK